MLKAEFIQGLKQNNVSKNAEKTTERLRAIWQPLPKPQRAEILSLVGLKKTAIERAYKTGNVSAKIVAAVSQVLSVDPLYLVGANDEERPFDDTLLVDFLKEAGYDIGKGDVAKKKRAVQKVKEPKVNTVEKDAPKNDVVAEDKPPAKPKRQSAPKVASAVSGDYSDLPAILASLSKILGANAQSRLEKLTEEDISYMFKSLNIQAGFNDEKKTRLALIKCLLLL